MYLPHLLVRALEQCGGFICDRSSTGKDVATSSSSTISAARDVSPILERGTPQQCSRSPKAFLCDPSFTGDSTSHAETRDNPVVDVRGTQQCRRSPQGIICDPSLTDKKAREIQQCRRSPQGIICDPS